MDTASFTERPFSVEDAPFIVAAHSLPHARGYVSPPPDEQHVIDNMNGKPDVVRRIVLDNRGERAGLWVLSVFDGWLAELHLVIAAAPRSGAGRYAVRSAKRYAFEEARVHRLWLEVTGTNVPAQRLYESEGFVHEGTFRDGFKNPEGGFGDLRHYGMLESEYVKAGSRRPDQVRS